MNLIKYRPLTDLVLGNRFDDFFDDIFDNRIWDSGSFYPNVDIRNEGNKYILEADLPGLTEKDIDVKVENNILSISSAKEEKKEEKKDGYILKERRGYSFTRSFVLPKDVDMKKIQAQFKNGVLNVTLSKKPEAKPKKIEVQPQ